MVWLEATYQMTTLFSLRPSWATSSGGKSLLVPSPYALKMALVDVAIRTQGMSHIELAWPWIRNLTIGVRLSRQIAITNTFTRIRRTFESKKSGLEKEADIADAKASGNWPWRLFVAYREYVYYSEPISLAFKVSDAYTAQLSEWLMQINYLGKRGGFVQLLAPPRQIPNADGYTLLTTQADSFPLNGIVQQLDDCDPQMKFEEANIYEKKKPKRVVHHIVLPYRLARSSRAYSLYEYTGT